MDKQDRLNGYGLVWGSQNKVMGWYDGLSAPVHLGRFGRNDYHNHITSVAFIDGSLMSAGYDQKIRNVLSQEEVHSFNGPLSGLTEADGKMIAIEGIDNHNPAKVFNVKTGKEIYQINPQGPSPKEGLSFRCINGLVSDGNSLYVSSENIIRIKPSFEGTEVEKVTEYMSDFAYIASNGAKVFSAHYHNSGSNPDGTELRIMPDNKRVAFLSIGEEEECNRYPQLFALVGDKAVMGFSNHRSEEHNLYSFDITDEMLKSTNGIKVEPTLLLKNAYKGAKTYGACNPITAVPKDALEKIIENI